VVDDWISMPIRNRWVGLWPGSRFRFAFPAILAVRETVFLRPPLVALHERVRALPFKGTRKTKPTLESNAGPRTSTVPAGFRFVPSQTM
jgi:hypothetical protein